MFGRFCERIYVIMPFLANPCASKEMVSREGAKAQRKNFRVIPSRLSAFA
jgi:hypothetical protein